MSAVSLAGQTFYRWRDHEGQRLGAALAFYILLSAAPLLTFIFLAVSIFYGQRIVEESIVSYTRTLTGSAAATVAEKLLTSPHNPTHSLLAAIGAFSTLAFGASGAFNELAEALNKLWDVPLRRKSTLKILLHRAFTFLLVVAAGGLIFGLMLAGTAVSLIRRFFPGIFPDSPISPEVANFAISLIALTLVFVLIYRFVPDLVLPWKILWTGAAVTALLFVAGNALLSLYLAKAGVSSAYGAAGSLTAIAFWVYYSAQIFLLGAEFTYVWSGRHRTAADTRGAG